MRATTIETGVIYCDDNLSRLAALPAESVDLIYLDPPFFSNRNYEVIWGDEAEVRSFEDRWEGGIGVYVDWMRERAIEMYRVLKPTGSFYLHCDWHAAHYLKVMLDRVFGEPHFQNEIIWYYRGAGVSPRRWGRRHDNIFFYTKGTTWTFNPDPVRGEYAEATKERFKHYVGNVRGSADFGQQLLNPKGKHPDDVWEISIVAPSARDRLGYPTQKPEKLMERIILASSNPGDIVLDPFAGCGTTLVVAHDLRRQWIGIDISPTAVGLVKRRMERVGATDVKLVGMPVTEDELRALKPFEFQNWVIQQLDGVHSPRKSGDMGIDGYTWFEHLPIQVKQSHNVGRNVVDNFETAVERSGKHAGVIIAFSFTKNAFEEAARAKSEKGLLIELRTVATMLGDTANIVTPERGLLMSDRPLPAPRPDDARPSVEQLVESSKAAPIAEPAPDENGE
jgi:DNA modification methylase